MDLASITHYIVTNNCVAHMQGPAENFVGGGGGVKPKKKPSSSKGEKMLPTWKMFVIFQVGRAPLYFCPPPPPPLGATASVCIYVPPSYTISRERMLPPVST